MDFKDLVRVSNALEKTPIKGKNYVTVPQRVIGFKELYPNGAITTDIVSLEGETVIIKATVTDDEGRVIATGHALEKESSSYINKTSFLENCVPLHTQILTKNGWKYYFQLTEGEEVWSLNMTTKKMELCKVIRINYYSDAPLLRLKTSRFDAVCTPGHKWIAETQCRPLEKKATSELTASWKIVQAVKQDIKPSDLGRRLGWLMCDCGITYAKGLPSTAYIRQSKYVDDVAELFGEGRKVKKRVETYMDSYEWVVPAALVRVILGAFGMASYRDLPKALACADLADVAGCYQSMMLADGSEGSFSSTYPDLVEAVQIACARLGIATTFIRGRMMEKSTKPIYTLTIKKTDGAWFSEMDVKKVPPQDVWCPTTENGTWVMKQNDFVTLTSNCETSAVGRALGFLGIGIEESIASLDEVESAMINQDVLATKQEKDGLKAECKKKNVSIKWLLEQVGCDGEMTSKQYGRAMNILLDLEVPTNDE